jgi:hypothetical protein
MLNKIKAKIEALATFSRGQCMYCKTWYESDAEAGACTQRCHAEWMRQRQQGK